MTSTGMEPTRTTPPPRGRSLGARIAKVVAALASLALADALAAEAISTHDRILERGWQTLSAQEIAAGTRPVRDHVALAGRALTEGAVRLATRRTRNGSSVPNSEQVSYFVPVVTGAWDPSQPVRVVVHTQPSGYNLTAPNIEATPPWRGAVVELGADVRRELHRASFQVADDAFVVDLAAGSSESDSDRLTVIAEAFYALAAVVAALALLASAVRSPWPRTTLARRIRRTTLGSGAGMLVMATLASPIPIALLGTDPELLNWLGCGVSGLIVLAMIADGAMSLWRAPAQTREAKELTDRLGASFEEIAETLDAELGGRALAKTDFRVLPSFLCRATPEGISLVPYGRVAWVYVRTAGTLTSLVLECVDYVTRGAAREGFVYPIEQAVAQQDVGGFVRAITERAPWAMQGWDPELGADRAEILRRYEHRRAAYPRGRFG